MRLLGLMLGRYIGALICGGAWLASATPVGLLDVAQLIATSDAIAVASAAGNVLVLSRANVTPFSALKEMARKLQTSHARTLGAVIGRF